MTFGSRRYAGSAMRMCSDAPAEAMGRFDDRADFVVGELARAANRLLLLGHSVYVAGERRSERSQVRNRLNAGGHGFELVWGFCCQVVILVCSGFFVRSGKGRSSSRRLRSGFAERAEGVKGPKRWHSLAACRLASLVFRSALTPGQAERRDGLLHSFVSGRWLSVAPWRIRGGARYWAHLRAADLYSVGPFGS